MELLVQIVVVRSVTNRNERKKIVLINDNVLCGEAFNLLLNEDNGFKIIAEIATLERLKSQEILRTFDLVLLNAGLPFEIIIPITEFLRRSAPEIPTVLFNARKPDQLVLQCIMNGVKGIVWLAESQSRLFFVCKKVLDGERHLGIDEPELNAKLKNTNDQLGRITDRELAVLKLFAKGYSYKKIGEELKISPRTVESHKNNILTKLELGSLKELIGFAVKNNII